MVDSLSLAGAAAAGFISFASPCVLPIVPGFLSVITGLDLSSADQRRGQSLSIARDTGLFVLGFSAVFIALGLTATTAGAALFRNQAMLTRVSGAVVLAMALYLLGWLVAKSPWLYQEKRFHPRLARFGPFAAPVAGVAFGFGWTPCIGPILTSVLAVAATRGRASEGATLLAAYSAGLGVPFLVTALAFGRLTGVFGWFRQHLRGLTMASATSLVVFGVLLLFNQLTWVTAQLQTALQSVGLEELIFLG